MLPTILITIDVEDWFQVENFRPWIPFETWDQRELRVEQNTHRLLNLFDSVELIAHSSKLTVDTAHSSQLTVKNQKESDYELSTMNYELAPKVHNELSAMSYQLNTNEQRTTDNGHTKKVRATFFALGWIANKLPNLIREIHSRGHEVASHGDNHMLCDRQSATELKKDLIDSKKKLEDIIGSPVNGYRAPNFSVNNDILKLIEDCGYSYDSSYNSFALHGRYGKMSLNGSSKKGLALQIADDFFELPISNLNLQNPMSYVYLVKFFRRKTSEANLTGGLSAMSLKRNDRNRFVLPWGGGAYFRLMPFPIFKRGVKKILNKENGYLFYLHPWEIDPDQPVVKNAPARFKFRHYSNLSKSLNKLTKFIYFFPKCQFITCNKYLKSLRQDLQD